MGEQATAVFCSFQRLLILIMIFLFSTHMWGKTAEPSTQCGCQHWQDQKKNLKLLLHFFNPFSRLRNVRETLIWHYCFLVFFFFFF